MDLKISTEQEEQENAPIITETIPTIGPTLEEKPSWIKGTEFTELPYLHLENLKLTFRNDSFLYRLYEMAEELHQIQLETAREFKNHISDDTTERYRSALAKIQEYGLKISLVADTIEIWGENNGERFRVSTYFPMEQRIMILIDSDVCGCIPCTYCNSIEWAHRVSEHSKRNQQ